MDEPIHVGVRDIAEARLDPAAALAFVDAPGNGGSALFVGTVRERNVGRSVTGIHYDIHRSLALAEFRRLAQQVADELGEPVKLYVEHASGKLAVGDLAVVGAAGTAHRDAAFRACRALIEAVKFRAPVWKQEHYTDGSSVWSEGATLTP